MVNGDLVFKVQRLHAAIEATEKTDISKFTPKVIDDGHRIGFYQDWTGGLSDADRANYVHSLISNIASLEYQLNKWADDNAYDKTKVKDAFNSSQALRIIHDLWNNDKHAGSLRQSKSGLWPRLGEIRSFLQLTTKAEKGSAVGLTFTPKGVPKILGNGTAKVIISGDILDRDGNNIGDLHKTALEAVKVWESVLGGFGVKLCSMLVWVGK